VDWHLAQVNVARGRAPIESPLMEGFMSLLDPVNALADAAPGFVWRLRDETGNATAIRPFDDERIMINLSVWESIEALHDFVYNGMHVEVFRRRREWFERFGYMHLALWWIPAGTLPTPEEAVERLEHLQEHGPTVRAFTFKRQFVPGDAAVIADAMAARFQPRPD
jgi:hypothetical protein